MVAKFSKRSHRTGRVSGHGLQFCACCAQNSLTLITEWMKISPRFIVAADHLSARHPSGPGGEVAKGAGVGTSWGGICPRTAGDPGLCGGRFWLPLVPCLSCALTLAGLFPGQFNTMGFQALTFLGGWLILFFSCSLSNSQALSHAQLGPPSATASPRAVRVVWQMQCKRDSLHLLFQLSTQESVFDAKWRAPLWVLEYNRK